jgi:uncharacterized membrane protein YidH (DUF202 family)
MLLAGIAVGIGQFAIGLQAFPANLQPGVLQSSVVESVGRTLASLSFLILISGVILMISGVFTFLRYRKENPAPYAEES